MQSRSDPPSYVKFSLIGLAVGLLVLLMVLAKPVLIPLAWALLLASLLLPLTRGLERRIPWKGGAIVLSLVILGVGVGGVLSLLVTEAYNFISQVPDITRKLSDQLGQWYQYAGESLGISYEEEPFRLIEQFIPILRDQVSTIQSTISWTFNTVLVLGLIPLYLFFLLYHRHRFRTFIHELYKGETAGRVMDTVNRSARVVQQYLSGMLIVTIIIAGLASIAFFSIGIDYAIFFAVFVAVMNLIPYIGVFVSSLIVVLYVLVSMQSLWYAVLTLLLLWVIQLLENNLITPYIVGRRISLNPLVVILAIFFGGLIWGVSGMVLFIPLTGVIKVLCDESEALRPYGYLIGDETYMK